MRKSNEEKNEKKVSTRSAQSKRVNTNNNIINNITETKESQDCQDKIIMQGINSKGFGIIPKLVMQDRRLTIQAKAIYAYFCSYAGNGETAFPSRDKIFFDLGIKKQAYYKHFNLLKEYGYIEVEQVRESGKFKHNIYTIVQIINAPCTDFRDTVKRDTAKQDNNNNIDSKITEKKNNSLVKSSLSSKKEEKQKEDQIKRDKTRQDKTDVAATLKAYEQTLKENIEFNNLCNTHKHDKAFIEELLSIMLDVVMSENKTITVASEKKNKELVKSVFLKLNYYNLDSVIQKYKNITTKIKKKRQYIITMLYNSYLEGEATVLNDVAAEEP